MKYQSLKEVGSSEEIENGKVDAGVRRHRLLLWANRRKFHKINRIR